MSETTGDLNAFWGRLLVEELTRHQICRFFVSPGSRSTPITSAIALSETAIATLCLDERAAAFQALGFARASGKPAVLVCSSGTAGANYFPAVIEASVDRIPMIVLTADRPPELRDTSANQTIRQMPFYGEYTRWQFDMPCPNPDIEHSFVLTTAAQLVAQSQFPTPGPVHLNCMFREPFTVSGDVALDKTLSSYLEQKTPYSAIYRPEYNLSEEQFEELAGLVDTKNGALAVGRLASLEEQSAVEKLASALNWPVIADICSGMRLGSSPEVNVLPYFDQMLLSENFAKRTFDVILRVGDPLISKRWHTFVKSSKARKIAIQSSADRQDQDHQLKHRFMGSIALICTSLSQTVSGAGERVDFSRAASVVERELEAILLPDESITEVAAARIVSQEIPENHALFLAASMPIRDMNRYAAFSRKRIPCQANRGASGIDGTIATACGFAEGFRRSTTLMIGDLASLHDLNSMNLLGENVPPLTIVIVNNGGGGIFSFLPIAENKEVFDPWFSTPHAVRFEKAAEMFTIPYFNPSTSGQFRAVYREALSAGKHSIIEIKTDRQENVDLHQSLQQRLRDGLNKII